MFSEAYDTGVAPMEFVNSMRKKGKLILGIGHRVKSVSNYTLHLSLQNCRKKQCGEVCFCVYSIAF